MSHAAAATQVLAQPSNPVSRTDLPLSCPRPDTPVWNLHPRVYLPIADAPNGESICPYCGAHYVLNQHALS